MFGGRALNLTERKISYKNGGLTWGFGGGGGAGVASEIRSSLFGVQGDTFLTHDTYSSPLVACVYIICSLMPVNSLNQKVEVKAFQSCLKSYYLISGLSTWSSCASQKL